MLEAGPSNAAIRSTSASAAARPLESATREPTVAAWGWSLAVLILPVAAVMTAIAQGVQPNFAATVAIVIVTPMFALAERWRPHAELWRRGQGDLLTDSLYALVL